MALPRNLFAPSFRRQRASLLFTAIVGFMVFTATLSVTAETTLMSLSLHWDTNASNMLTVEIPAVSDEATLSQAERIDQTLSVLHAMPGVGHINVLSDNDTADLLKPWISDTTLLKSLPVPTLIDIERAPGATLRADDIASHLKNIVADVRVDDHVTWLSDLKHLINGIVLISSVMAAMAALTLAITVNLFCRAVMTGETGTITLLHTMGADDHDIARHFQALATHLAWPASFFGFAFAVLGAGIVLGFLTHFTDLGHLNMMMWAALGGFAILIPFGAVLVAAMSARYSVSKLLQATP